MKPSPSSGKKVKAWAIVTSRGSVTGMAPYHFYSHRKFAEYYARKANALRGGGLEVVKVDLYYSPPNN